MPDRKALVDPIETPEDVATLYSWANLHGAKYRDFSASRAQTREKARQRVQDAIDVEHGRVREEAETLKNAETARAEALVRAADAERQVEQAIRENALRVEQQAKLSAERVLPQRTWQTPRPEPMKQGRPVMIAAPQSVPPYYPQQALPPQQMQQSEPPQPQQIQYPAYAEAQAYAPAVTPATYAPVPQQAPLQTRNLWAPVEPRESAARPAWLAADRGDVAPQLVLAPSEETLQASRDRLTSRWFALKGVFANQAAIAEPLPFPPSSRAPVLAVFSLAGGVGKTSLVATLGRALSARGERVLLVDTAAYGLLPFFFGARDQRPGVLRTFNPPGASGDAPLQMLTVDTESLGPETAPQEMLTQEISRNARGASRVIVDLATASGATTRRILRMAPTVLVPIIPDMSSVISVSSIDSFFRHNVSGSGQQVLPFYVLNQFDPSVPLHLDVREVLREQLADRLLPFALRRTPAVSEALAEGMTVVDYAPNSTVAEDFGSLAGWVKSLAAPATTGYRGVRWSER
jgi:cellulose synthase operon protein YhjQ